MMRNSVAERMRKAEMRKSGIGGVLSWIPSLIGPVIKRSVQICDKVRLCLTGFGESVMSVKGTIGDDYAVVTVEKNGSARPYCIDGCSTPPGMVNKLFRLGIFIFENKDNPTGAGPGGFGSGSSFFGACASHDKCYQTCNGNDQETCDDRLLADMLAVCRQIPADHVTTFTNTLGFQDEENTRNKCESAANNMHTGLQSPLPASKRAFKVRRQQYCQCC